METTLGFRVKGLGFEEHKNRAQRRVRARAKAHIELVISWAPVKELKSSYNMGLGFRV